MDENKLVVSAGEAADLLDLSRSTVYRMIQRGALPALRVGRRRLIPRAAIVALLDFDPGFADAFRHPRDSRNGSASPQSATPEVG